MTDIHALTQQVANYLAGRSVQIRWEDPPSSTAVGQVVKTHSGRFIVYVAYLTCVRDRFKLLLHELAHVRLDHDWIPKSNDHRLPPASVKKSQEERAAWRANPREKRAQKQADEWYQYSENNAYKYWTGYIGRETEMVCRLECLLDWEG